MFKFKTFQDKKKCILILAEEVVESEEEEDSAVALKKAGSEVSEPDVSKLKVCYKIETCKHQKLIKIIFYKLIYLLNCRKLWPMAKTAVKANLTGAVIQTARAQVAMTKANIKIFASVLSRSTFC